MNWKWYFYGYGQYIVFKTRKEAQDYLKNSSSIYRIKDLKKFDDDSLSHFSEHSKTKVFEIIDNVAVPLEM